MTPVLTIRKGTPEDAKQLTEFARRAFAETFGPANTAEDLALHLSRTYAPELQRRELLDPHFATILALSEGNLAGYAQLRDFPAPESVTMPGPIELLRFYVDKAWHGQGVAQALMDAVFATARERGNGSVWLCVWQENPRAISFYGHQGFATVGAQSFILGTDHQMDWVMARTV